MDITWILICFVIILAVMFCLFLAIANFAPQRFFDIYHEIDKIAVYRDELPQFIDHINAVEFNGQLTVFQTDKEAGDAYLGGGRLLLSDITLNHSGVASFATLAHELGHAIQDRDSKKLKVKSVLTIIEKIIGPFMFPLLIAGAILFFFFANLSVVGISLMAAGAGIFLLSLLLKLFTINIEKDASKKAMELLQKYTNFDKEQLKKAKKLLNSAKLTYWGSFFASLLGWTMLVKNKYI